MKNLIGQRFGRLTVIEKTKERKHGNVVWKCKCDCGNEHFAYTNLLTSGGCVSCGCFHKDKMSQVHKQEDIIGNRFGKLIAIRKDPDHKASNGSYMIECKCDCGNTILVAPNHLRSHHVNSCGCLKISIGELKISQLLTKYNIPFETEKKFDDCRNPKTNYPLRFDFFVNNSYLIEYDGRQHSESDGGWGENLKDIQDKDRYKTEWCEKHNIPLIRISYKQYESLTINDLIPSGDEILAEKIRNITKDV